MHNLDGKHSTRLGFEPRIGQPFEPQPDRMSHRGQPRGGLITVLGSPRNVGPSLVFYPPI